jgi:hypothetical protein
MRLSSVASVVAIEVLVDDGFASPMYGTRTRRVKTDKQPQRRRRTSHESGERRRAHNDSLIEGRRSVVTGPLAALRA